MSFFELPGLNEVKETRPAPEGTYDLCIISAKVNEKDGKTNVQCVLEIEGEPDYSNVFHYLSIPGSDDDAEKKKTKMLFLARFMNQFGLSLNDGLETEQLVGARATAGRLTLDEYTPTDDAGNPNGPTRTNNKFEPNPLPTEG